MIKNILITIIILSFVLSLENYGQNRSKKILEKETTQSSNKSKRETSVVREHNEPNKLLSLINNALELYKKKKYEEAIPIFREAILLAAESNDLEVRDKSNLEALLAVGLYNQAIYLKDNGKYSEAEEYYVESLQLFRRIHKNKDHLELANCLNSVALFYALTDKMTKSEELYKEALEMARRIYKNGDHSDIINLLSSYSNLLSNMGKLTEAEKFSREALEMSSRLYNNEDNIDIIQSMNNLGIVLFKIGKYEEGENYINKSLEMGKRFYKGLDNPFLATLISNAAFLYENNGRYLEAENFNREALAMRRRIYKGHNNPDLGTSINNLALLLFKRGRFLEAEPLFKEALEIFRGVFGDGSHTALGTILSNTASAFQTMGKYKNAEHLHAEAISILRNVFDGKDSPELGNALNNAAMFYGSQGNYTVSEELIRESLNMRKRLYNNGDHSDIAISLQNLATILLRQKKDSEAMILAKESMDMNRRIYKNKIHPNLASSINVYTDILLFYDKLDEAEELAEEALELNNRIYNGGDHDEIVFSLVNLANLHTIKGDYKTAEAYYIKGIEMSHRIYKENAVPKFAFLYASTGLLYEIQNKFSDAEKHYLIAQNMYKKILRNIFPYITEKEKEIFLSTFLYIFESFNTFVINHKNENERLLDIMYNNQLTMKGILGYESYKTIQKISNSGNDELLSLYGEWKKQKENFALLSCAPSDKLIYEQDVFKTLEKKINEIEKELNRKANFVFQEKNEIDINLNDIQGNLRNNEMAIEIIRFNEYVQGSSTDRIFYSALITSQDSTKRPELILLKNGLELEGTLFKKYKDYIAASQYQEKGEEISDDGKLYDAFWGKIAEKIEGKTRVYLSSDGVYNQININSLYNPQTKKYVIDETEIVLLTSTRELAVEKKERKYDNMAELFGFPNYDLGVNEQKELVQDYDLKRKRLLEGVRLTELPGTRIEIEESGNILQQNKWVVNEYLGDNALEENLKKINSPRLLHIATHGVFLEEEQIERDKKFSFGMMGDQQKIYYDNPLLRSALFLSGANRSRKGINVEGVEDGVFTGYEAQNLNLMNTELVILSACETGLGVIKSGEGVYGLQRAFRVAGAENIIMSLWKVSDEATKDLILSFYKKWTSGKSVKEAFREAQRELRDKYPGAYYWAAFVLISG